MSPVLLWEGGMPAHPGLFHWKFCGTPLGARFMLVSPNCSHRPRLSLAPLWRTLSGLFPSQVLRHLRTDTEFIWFSSSRHARRRTRAEEGFMLKKKIRSLLLPAVALHASTSSLGTNRTPPLQGTCTSSCITWLISVMSQTEGSMDVQEYSHIGVERLSWRAMDLTPSTYVPL